MAGHSSEKLWDGNNFGDIGVGETVKNACIQVLSSLNLSEESYQDLLELWSFAGGSDQLVANQLFFDIWSVRVSDPVGAPGIVDTQANPQEVGKVADAKAAMLALHQLYEALTNVAVAQSDRVSVLRRMT